MSVPAAAPAAQCPLQCPTSMVVSRGVPSCTVTCLGALQLRESYIHTSTVIWLYTNMKALQLQPILKYRQQFSYFHESQLFRSEFFFSLNLILWRYSNRDFLRYYRQPSPGAGPVPICTRARVYDGNCDSAGYCDVFLEPGPSGRARAATLSSSSHEHLE